MGSKDSIINLVNFVKDNEDWEDKLSKAPYFVKVKRHFQVPELTMFSYSQFESDFNNEIVRVCRGSVLWIDNHRDNQYIWPILVPFYKFGNFNESYADKINWDKCQVQMKLDGSLIKVARRDNMNPRFLWTTNNSFDLDIEVPDCIPAYDEEKSKGAKTFHQLLNVALGKDRGWIENIPNGWTLMFELLSPRNRIIVKYKETELILLGGRNQTWQEIAPATIKEITKCPCNIPNVLPLHSLEQVTNYCDAINNYDEEGVVVCDCNYNRIKIKCAAYKSLKFLKGEDHFSDKGIYRAIKDGSIDDAISAWPEIKNRYEEILQEHNDLKELIGKIYVFAHNKKSGFPCYDYITQQKQYAEWVKQHDPVVQSLLFECGKAVANCERYVNNFEYKEMVEYLNHLRAFYLEN
jgi:hypothetical protein